MALTQLRTTTATPLQQRLKPAAQGAYGAGRGGRPWRRLVEQVKRRDHYTCQECGKVTARGACDHTIPRSQGGSDDLSNLKWLCDDGPQSCHAIKSQQEAKAGGNA